MTLTTVTRAGAKDARARGAFLWGDRGSANVGEGTTTKNRAAKASRRPTSYDANVFALERNPGHQANGTGGLVGVRQLVQRRRTAGSRKPRRLDRHGIKTAGLEERAA